MVFVAPFQPALLQEFLLKIFGPQEGIFLGLTHLPLLPKQILAMFIKAAIYILCNEHPWR